MNSIRKHLSYANVVATLALVFAMSGSAIAAKHYLINSTKQINPKVIKKLKGNTGKPGLNGAAGPHGQVGAQGKEGPLGKEGPRGNEGPAGLSALSSLPSGRSESGDYGIRTPNNTTSGFLDQAITFPIPLSTRISHEHILYSKIETPIAHCSGPGKADPGYLCIYSANSIGTVRAGGFISEFEDRFPQEESGNFGFDMEWGVTEGGAFDIGTYTVTAP